MFGISLRLRTSTSALDVIVDTGVTLRSWDMSKQKLPAGTGGYGKVTGWSQSVNDSEGNFVGFVRAKTKDDVRELVLPKGYVKFGSVF